jgi:hypothetical protein
MPKMYHREEWFYELSPTALSEAEFESLLMRNGDVIRSNSTIVPFKKTVYGPETSARADLAIVPSDYQSWAVIEVELELHDLYRHVLPQVRTLREASYDQDHAAYLHSKYPGFDGAKLSDMMRGNPPEVIVLVNKPNDEWRRELARYSAHMMVFEIYRSHSNRHIFVIDGELPKLAHDFLTELSFAAIPRCLHVSSPAALTFQVGEKVQIFIGGQVTLWERFQTATEVYLTPVGTMPIGPGQKYVLTKMANGHLAIRPLNSMVSD